MTNLKKQPLSNCIKKIIKQLHNDNKCSIAHVSKNIFVITQIQKRNKTYTISGESRDKENIICLFKKLLFTMENATAADSSQSNISRLYI